jgi:allantoinase
MITVRANRVVTPEGERPVSITIHNGTIVSLTDAADPAPAATVVDIPDDQVVLPGLVDSHVHVNEPGRTHWEGFTTATAAAAAGGVTTIVDMPLNSIPATVDVPSLRRKQLATDGQLAVDVAFWGGAIPGNAGRLRELHDAGVVGFKCFLLPSGVPEFPPLDPDGVALAMRTIADFDGLLIAHAEDPAVIDAAPVPRGRRYADFVASRPDAAEANAVSALLAQTRATGCRTHIVHLSSAASLPAIRAAKAEGLPVTVETCPHYLTLRAETIPDGATQFKCCPPIRDDGNRLLLWEALREGTIDCVVSDHSPCTKAAKRLDIGDFGEAWGGIASVQLGLPAMWTHARERGFGLTELARWMCSAPAELVGLTDRGRIAPGLRADLCVFAPDKFFEVDPRKLRHRNPISPYAGRLLRGIVRQTWLRGVPIDLDGSRVGRLVAAGGSAEGSARTASSRAGTARAGTARAGTVAARHNGEDD